MKPLPEVFVKKKFSHKQIKRRGDVAIYERQGLAHHNPHWEVIIIQKHEARTIAGKEIPAAEGYPSAEQWGTAGWTCGTLARALVRFDALTARAARQVEIPAALTGDAHDPRPNQSSRTSDAGFC